MNKLMLGVLSSLAFGLVFMVPSLSDAANMRGAKAKATLSATASATRLCNGPGVVYGIHVSTGATTTFAVFRDSNTANTSSEPAIVVSAGTSAQHLTFEPPVQFRNGISFNGAVAINTATAVYECGTVNRGY